MSTPTMSCRIILRSRDGIEAVWSVSWKLQPVIASDQPFYTADIIFQSHAVPIDFPFRQDLLRCHIEDHTGKNRIRVRVGELGHPQARNFLFDTLEATTKPFVKGGETGIKCVAPIHAGNIIRADVLRQRMQDLEYIETIVTLAQPLQHYAGGTWPPSMDLLSLLKASAGAIRLRAAVRSASDVLHQQLALLELDLHNRLPSPLCIPHLRRRTLAFLEGSELLPNTGGCATQFYTAARSLGIDVVVLGVDGHWLQGTEYSHWRKTFLPIEFGHDSAFPARIVAAIKQSREPVEALLTCFDSYHVAVSQAAHELGLPHDPPEAYKIATDKFELSAFENRRCFRATGTEHLSKLALTEDIPWPVIVKPCRGWGSELVFRADSPQQLMTRTKCISTATSHGSEFVIEPYCDGPEVDINFVLYDGELLFWEIGDENPKTADEGSDSFHELDCVSPSALPTNEQHILRDSIFKTLLKLGFRHGIFHCEARIADSTHEWRITESGSPILQLRSDSCNKSPSCFLMDCNIRPPGLNSSDIVETTWGVDYWALLATIPLREEARTRALAQPYRNGPQYFADMIFVSATFDACKQGIWNSGNVTEELKQRRPDLAKHISKALTYKTKGDRIPHPSTGTNTFVAYLNVFSRESREQVLDVATQVRREVYGGIEYE
ncbi:hypothetical protein AC578_8825 [Pseudocercospora eumusae]|uniref:ATP-grasp domain-containing protein n=1 Tax=Pseudocercospora eumusae TaxID=321146 RepID=A0A139H4Y9_9PEZI|nr:hypothetical protein AC578_8825 [Pseudocercospora eumusae]